jgi:hypothetical protein
MIKPMYGRGGFLDFVKNLSSWVLRILEIKEPWFINLKIRILFRFWSLNIFKNQKNLLLLVSNFFKKHW